MSGRVENQLKIFKNIEKEFNDYPDYVIDWYYYLKANDKSATTCRTYINYLIHFLKEIDYEWQNVSLNSIEVKDLTKYFISIKTKDGGVKETSCSYRRTIWACLNNFFEYMYTSGKLSENLIKKAGIKPPQNNDLERINQHRILLTKEDFKKILDAVENGVGSHSSQCYQKRFRNRDKAIMLIFMTTGMRESALREIDVRDVDLETGELTVIDKRHKFHKYILNAKTVQVLKDWLLDRYFILGGVKKDPLFVSKDGNRLSVTSLAEMVDKYASHALGYHISPHKLRSGLASILYSETKDIEYVRRVIGHSNVETTQRYVVTDNKEREAAADMITNMIM